MEVRLRSTAQVIKKAEWLNIYLEKNGFSLAKKKNGELKKNISCEKEVEIDDAGRVTEWYIYRQ